MIAGAAVVSAPLLTILPGLVPGVEAAEAPKTAGKNDLESNHPNCNGCQACTILYSNCQALNGRHCWCEPA